MILADVNTASDHTISSQLPPNNYSHAHFLASNNCNLSHETTATTSQKEEIGEDTQYTACDFPQSSLWRGESVLSFLFLPLATNASSLDSSSFRAVRIDLNTGMVYTAKLNAVIDNNKSSFPHFFPQALGFIITS